MQRKYLILLSVAGLVITLDQATKLYIHTHFTLSESLPIIKDFFSFTYVRNPGAAFGLFGTSHETFRTIFFLSIPPIALIVILLILKSVPKEDTVQILALSSIFGGAIGNYIDRLRFQYVIDFIEVHYKNVWSYPAFNIADSAIVVGVSVLALLMFLQARAEKRALLAKTEWCIHLLLFPLNYKFPHIFLS